MNLFLAFLLIITAIFLILIVLIQRGRGGGLAGAFGGLGGQSAFGTKAGDLFTRITIGIAAFWIILCVVSVRVMSSHTSMFSGPEFAGSKGNSETGAKGATEGTDTKVGGTSTDSNKATESGKAAEVPSGTAPSGTAPADTGSTPAATTGDTPAASAPAASTPAAAPTEGTSESK